nr:biopolymer transporter ExbD [Phragmitibacter flavus]
MENGEPEFQIAPIIDCLLVLLVFFMSITSAEVLQIDDRIALPVAPDSKKKEKVATQEGALNVRWDGRTQKSVFSFEGPDYENIEDLTQVLRERKAAQPLYHVIIRGDKNLPAIEIQRTMSVIGAAGIDNISFSALNK